MMSCFNMPSKPDKKQPYSLPHGTKKAQKQVTEGNGYNLKRG